MPEVLPIPKPAINQPPIPWVNSVNSFSNFLRFDFGIHTNSNPSDFKLDLGAQQLAQPSKHGGLAILKYPKPARLRAATIKSQ